MQGGIGCSASLRRAQRTVRRGDSHRELLCRTISALIRPHSLKGPRSGLTRAEGNFSEGLGANPGSSDRTWACTEQVRWGRPQAKTQKQRKAGRTRGTASIVKGGWAGGVQVSQERRPAGFSARLTASLRATESHWGFKWGSVKIRLKCRHLTLGAVPGDEWRAGPSRRPGRSEGGPTRRAG